jgi:DNA adenine methylase
MPTIRPPVKWHGGKRYLAKRIIEHFPPHKIYLEPFGGAASVLLNKPPSEIEVYNDIDHRISRLFRVLRDKGDKFLERCDLTPYSQVEFEEAENYPDGADDVMCAWCDFIRWRQSFGGQGKSWSYTTGRSRGGMAGDVNAWWTAIDGMHEVIDRLKRVQIICTQAICAIKTFDSPDTLIYCDPPYVHETRTSPNVYKNEMSDEDHRALSRILRVCEGKIIVSGYPCPLYDDCYSGWNRIDFDIANHASGGKIKARETECIWLNF